MKNHPANKNTGYNHLLLIAEAKRTLIFLKKEQAESEKRVDFIVKKITTLNNQGK